MQSKNVKLNRELAPTINFRRGSKRSAQAKANISKGVKESWKKRGAKLAAGGLAIGATGLALKKKGITPGSIKSAAKNKAVNLANKADEAIAKRVEKGLYEAIRNPNAPRTKGTEVFEALLGSKTAKAVVDGSARGAKERVATQVKEKAKDVAYDAGSRVKATVDIPKNTAQAFQEGLKTKTSKDAPLNKAARGLARIRARAEARAKADMKKVGFTSTRNVANLIEFAKQKARAPRKSRRRTAAERKAISEGLKEYYAGQPRSRNAIDDSNKLSMAALRLSRTGKNVLQMAGQGLDLYQRVQAMNRKQSGWEKAGNAVMGGANLLSSVSGSYGRIGSGTRSLVSSADVVDSLRSGLKAEKLGLAKDKFKYESGRKHDLASGRAKSYRRIANSARKANRKGGTKYEDMVTRRAKLLDSDLSAAVESVQRKKKKEKSI